VFEIFVKAGSPLTGLDTSTTNSDCPYSQRVLIALEELGVKHTTVPIDLGRKPNWFHLLHPEGRVPVLYAGGDLICGSKEIMGYLVEKFPKKAASHLARSNPAQAQKGSMSLTRFFPRFIAAVSGNDKALLSMQAELRSLNDQLVVACSHRQNTEDSVFFGGNRFSREDTTVAPMLNLVDVAGTALLGADVCIPEDCVALRRYIVEARKIPSFAKTVAPNEVIVRGFRKLREHKSNATEVGVVDSGTGWLSDALE
jgi:glutathione S-transferase